MNNLDHLKQLIRKESIKQRESIDQNYSLKANEQIIGNLLKILSQNNHDIILGLYLPMKGEPDILGINPKIAKTLALPKIIDQQMIFVKYQPGDALEQGKFAKLMQPVSNEEILPNIIITPGLAFSIKGDRLGFGYGNYDKYLYKMRKFCQPTVIGVCFHENLKLFLPNNGYDQKMNYIVTDQITLKI